jgi:hypothetical protein
MSQSKGARHGLVKHMVANLVRNPKDKPSQMGRRKRANLNQDYRGATIRQTYPLT